MNKLCKNCDGHGYLLQVKGKAIFDGKIFHTNNKDDIKVSKKQCICHNGICTPYKDKGK